MDTPTVPPPPEMPTDAEMLIFVRQRLQALERAVQYYEFVLDRTSRERERAYRALQDAQVRSFREAIICDLEVSDSDREMWLTMPVEGGE